MKTVSAALLFVLLFLAAPTLAQTETPTPEATAEITPDPFPVTSHGAGGSFSATFIVPLALGPALFLLFFASGVMYSRVYRMFAGWLGVFDDSR